MGEKESHVKSESDGLPPPRVHPTPRPMRDLRSSYQVPKSTLGKSSPGHVKLSPMEMMGALDSMSKAEKKALKNALQ